jgi:hypothetical protein
MSQRDDSSPRREELAAYFDGELSGPRRRQFEQWLADQPAGQADLEEWRQLAQEWQASRAAEPSDAAWRQTWQRIEAATRKPAPSSRWRLARHAATTAAALAAALLLGVLIRPTPEEAEEPLVLASHADIEIISMDAADSPALIVGHPPLHEALVLADASDIAVEHIEPDHDGSMPSIRWWAGVEAPMIVATLTPDPER